MKTTISRWLSAYSQWAHYIGEFQSRALLTVYYFTAALPFVMIIRLFGDPLHLRPGRGVSRWLMRTTQDEDMAAARQRF